MSNFHVALESITQHTKTCYVLTRNPAKIPQGPMAYFVKSGSNWRACIERKGIRKSKTFPSKGAAVAWAGRIEADILAGDRGEIPNKTFGGLLDRYEAEVSARKKGARWESVRIALVKRDPLAARSLRVLGSPDIAAWRDRRLQAVSEASVRREWNLLSHACSIAVKEWHWLKANPFTQVRRPRSSQPRTRVMADAEWELLKAAAKTESHAKVLIAAEFALETGMRAGEIVGLSSINGRVAHLVDTKNGTSRDVPLSARAVDLASKLPLGLSSATLDIHWRGLTKLAGIEGLHFHDLRHNSATRWSKILNPFQLCRMFGWKDMKQAMTYYNESAEDVAKLL